MPPTPQSDIDKTLTLLQVEFKRSLPEKVEGIEKLWASILAKEVSGAVAVDDCYRIAHNLAGSGGTFGAVMVSSVSQELVHALRQLSNKEQITENNETLITDLILKLKSVASEWNPSEVPYLKPLEKKIKRKGNLIYLAEDDVLLAKDLVAHLENDNFVVKHFSDLESFTAAVHQEAPSAVIMDYVFQEEGKTGADSIAELKSEMTDCPPVIFISVRNDIESRLKAAQVGAQRFITKPLNKTKLSHTLNGLLDRTETSPFRVLLVDDDISILEYYKVILTEAGMDVLILSNPLETLVAVEKFKPDVIVLDLYMTECSGPEIAQVIRQDDKWAMTSIMFLSAETDLSVQLESMNLGAESFMVKPVEAEHLVNAITTKAKHSRWSNKLNNDLKVALREGEYQLVASNQHNISSTADVSGRIISVNDKFCEISGYSKNELIGKNHRLLKSDYHPDEFYEDMWKTISGGQVWHGRICNYNKKGERYWVESTIVPFLDEKGQPYKYVSARTDVTKVLENELRLELSQKFSNIGTWDWDIKTGNLFWSERIWSLFGYDKEIIETTYENFVAAIHEDDRTLVSDAITNCVEKGVEYDIEHRVVWPDGSIHWLHESGDVVRNQVGVPLHMLGNVQDITARKNAEAQEKETEERFTFAVDGAGDGVWDWNINTGVMQFSRLYMEMLGYTKNELPHVVESWISSVHPDDLPAAQNSLQDYLEKRIPDYSVEVRLRCKDDSYKWILCRGTVVNCDDKGKPLRMIGIHSDITNRKEAEYALIESREEAENANRAKSQFLSSMSHELRTPMNAIMGFGQLLEIEHDNPLSVSQKENVSEIMKASEHLLELINEVLDLSKIEAGRIDLSIEDVSLGNVITESLQLVSPLAEKRGISMKFVRDKTEIDLRELMEDKSIVRADYTRIKQVIINLLSNAVKYNNVNGTITIQYEETDKHNFRINISDTGKGINPEQQDYLFTAFNRLGAENTEIEGSGIGLVITKNIVDLMGGKIGFNSKVDEGSTFWFELPSGSDTLLDEEKPQSSATEVELTEERTVLYIEDNPANLRLVNQLLSRLPKLHMWSAHEPHLGLDLAEEHNPDLILLDINLPGLNGYEVLKLLRKSKVTCNTPVIAISANAMPKDIEKGIEAGFDEYITKPININKLLSTVDKKLTKS